MNFCKIGEERNLREQANPRRIEVEHKDRIVTEKKKKKKKKERESFTKEGDRQR